MSDNAMPVQDISIIISLIMVKTLLVKLAMKTIHSAITVLGTLNGVAISALNVKEGQFMIPLEETVFINVEEFFHSFK